LRVLANNWQREAVRACGHQRVNVLRLFAVPLSILATAILKVVLWTNRLFFLIFFCACSDGDHGGELGSRRSMTPFGAPVALLLNI